MDAVSLPAESTTIVVGGREQTVRDLARPLSVRGALAMLFGVVALAWPSSWIEAVTVILGGATFFFGFAELVEAGRRRRRHRLWGYEAVRGVLTCSVGLFVVSYNQLDVQGLAVVIGACWAVHGVLEIAQGASQTRAVLGSRNDRDRRTRITRGVLAVILGVAAAVWPDITGRTLTVLIGSLFVVTGLLLIVAGRALRRAGELQPVLRMEVLTE